VGPFLVVCRSYDDGFEITRTEQRAKKKDAVRCRQRSRVGDIVGKEVVDREYCSLVRERPLAPSTR
jgi:hypothetical protein